MDILNPAVMEQNVISQHTQSGSDEALVELHHASGRQDAAVSRLRRFLCFAEKARDYLHKTGRFIVIGGIISPVHDSYGKPVS